MNQKHRSEHRRKKASAGARVGLLPGKGVRAAGKPGGPPAFPESGGSSHGPRIHAGTFYSRQASHSIHPIAPVGGERGFCPKPGRKRGITGLRESFGGWNVQGGARVRVVDDPADSSLDRGCPKGRVCGVAAACPGGILTHERKPA